MSIARVVATGGAFVVARGAVVGTAVLFGATVVALAVVFGATVVGLGVVDLGCVTVLVVVLHVRSFVSEPLKSTGDLKARNIQCAYFTW